MLRSSIRRLQLSAPLALAAIAVPAVPAPALAAHSCGSIPVVVGGQPSTATAIKAKGVSCAKARSVVRATVKGKANGWKLSRGKSGVKLTRNGATVSFHLVCKSDCDRPQED